MLDQDITLKADELYLAGQKQTDGSGENAAGIYARDTRWVRRLDVAVNGEAPEVLGVRALAANRMRVFATNRSWQEAETEVYGHSLGLEQDLELTDHIRLRLTARNYAQRPIHPEISLRIDSDFRDLFAIRGFHDRDRGTYPVPTVIEGGVALRYLATDGVETGIDITFDPAPDTMTQQDGAEVTVSPRRSRQSPMFQGHGNQPPIGSGVVATFSLSLLPGDTWQAEVRIVLRTADPRPLSAVAHLPEREVLQPGMMRTSDEGLNAVLVRSTTDLAMLQTTFPEGSLIAAGMPWFVAPFGRDSLIAGLQTLPLSPWRTAATLRVLAAHQATTADPWRDQEPGKILHEIRYGEMARTGQIPHTPYYGTIDATSLFAWILAETVAWTGDEVLWRELEPNARAAFAWMRDFGDRDGDTLIEYPTHENDGVHITNPGWKDSWDSLNGADGRPPTGDIALVEVQGYAFAACRRLASIARLYGDPDWAADLERHAERIRVAVERLFWMPEHGTYAQALDGDKRQVAVVSSNPGHLLLTGLPAPERAASVARGLADPHMNSGWGVRTLSTTAPTFNPMSYHNGSVWPHDNSLIVAGLAAVGEGNLAGQIFNELLDVALSDPDLRLPELFCGFPRAGAASDAPIPYPVSCIPQAWAAGSIPYMLMALLGLRISDDGREITVAPALPASIDWVEVTGLRAGGKDVTIRIRREADGYSVEGVGPVRQALPTEH